MSERIQSDAVLCAIPDKDWLKITSIILRKADLEITYAHDWQKMIALLQSHAFKGVFTVSSWVKEAEATLENLKFSDLLKDTLWMNLFDKSEHDDRPNIIGQPYTNPRHGEMHIPGDVEELILHLKLMGLLPKNFKLSE